MNSRENLARFTAAAVVAVGMLTRISDAQAFRMIQNTSTGRVTAGALVACNDPGGFAHWTNSSTINYYHNTAGQGSNKASALQTALNAWTNVPNANHVPVYAGTTTAGWATDGLNTLLWAVGNGCTDNCLALTALVLQSGQVIVETDVTFNANFSWNINGADFDTEAIAAHEIGHSLGIHHTEVSSSPLPTMATPYFGAGGRSLESDDFAALQCAESRYPLPVPGAPGAPTSLLADQLCNGHYRLTWNAPAPPPGAYELYYSSNSSFSPQNLYWSGAATFKTVVTGPPGTILYFRVRACNGGACSGYSNSLQLHGFSGCGP